MGHEERLYRGSRAPVYWLPPHFTAVSLASHRGAAKDNNVSANHQDGPSSPEIAVKVEPDEVPTAMLTKLAIVVTIGVIASFIFVKALFDQIIHLFGA